MATGLKKGTRKLKKGFRFAKGGKVVRASAPSATKKKRRKARR